jgi:hypothetical protein
VTASRRPLHPIPWWWAVLGAAAVGVAIWGSTWWLLAQTHGLHGVDEAQTRMDAIKTGLSVGAGTGGAVALLLALRRQWLNERDLAHREAVDQRTQVHADRVAAATEHDATERRVTDLYVKAVDQLGSVQAAVRLGGLYALKRLGQNNPDHRQIVIDVICAYLRMPYIPPAESPAPGDSEQDHRREELQVRQTAQRILADHLRDETYVGQRADGPAPETFWPDIDLLDLTGAHLVDFHLMHCRVRAMQFNDVTFTGETLFRGTICDLAFFQGATFSHHTDFRGATFTNSAWFSFSTFDTEVWFHADEHFPGVCFGRHVSFQGVTFAEGARFNRATFSGSVDFNEARYGCGAETVRLEGARVQDPSAVSPEINAAASSWPPGWVVEPGTDGTGTPAWSAAPPQNLVGS